MEDRTIAQTLDGLLEDLSALEHERWAHWQSYLHAKCKRNDDGSLTIPAKLVAHWEKQMTTEYSDLSEEEKESDRDQVRNYLPVIEAALVSNNKQE
jgi:hypothetical protein